MVDFITKFHAMQQVIWMLFHLSIYALLAAILLAVHYNYKAYMAWVITASALFFGAVSMYCCSTVRCSVSTKGDPLGSSVCVTIVRRTDWNHLQSTASTCVGVGWEFPSSSHYEEQTHGTRRALSFLD